MNLQNWSSRSNITYNALGLRNTLFAFLEQFFVIFTLILYTGAFTAFLVDAKKSATDGSLLFQSVYLGIYLVVVAFFLLNPVSFVKHAFTDRLIPLLVLLAVLSIFWSPIPELTFRRGIALAGTTLFGIYLSYRFTLNQIIRMIGIVCLIIVVSSIATIVFYPGQGIMQGIHQGSWRGIFEHKNTLGRIMSFSIMIQWLLCIRYQRWSWLFIASGTAALVLLLQANSVTSIIILVVVIPIILILRTLRVRLNLLLSFGLISAAAIILITIYLWVNLDGIAQAFGRDLTLTGRTALWQMSLDSALNNAWLGHGYSGFWLGWDGSGSAQIWSRLTWEPFNAHNGYIDLVISLGFVGASLFLFSLLRAFVSSVLFFRHRIRADSYLPISFFIFLLLMNLTESSFMLGNNIFWALQVALTIYVVKSQTNPEINNAPDNQKLIRER